MTTVEVAVLILYICLLINAALGWWLSDKCYKLSVENIDLRDKAHKWDSVENNLKQLGEKWVSRLSSLDGIESCSYDVVWYLTIYLNVVYKDGRKIQYKIPYYTSFSSLFERNDMLEDLLKLLDTIAEAKNETRN